MLNDSYPTETHHGWKYIAFGPDGKLYVPVGAPCNICESEDSVFASITRINADGTGREIFAKGIRNSVGFTWHPQTHELWFTDNGRDMLGEDKPSCELNHAPVKGLHFGFPNCHQCDKPCDRHVNCKNDDCHLLFIQCTECEERANGCCTPKCMEIASLPIEEQRKLRKGRIKNGPECLSVYKSRLRPKLSEILKKDISL